MKPLRVLAVSPRFAPSNGADTHRLRLLLAHAAEAGWQVEVLAVRAEDVPGPSDPWLAARLPAEVPVHRVGAAPAGGWGRNGLAQRSVLALYREGCRLLADGGFDLVFFSTTEFPLHLLGPLWRRRCGVPFCMDFQDPWVNDYYRLNPDITSPGGRFKYAVANTFNRWLEAWVVRGCGGFLAVSQAYLDDLARRHGDAVRGKPVRVHGFPAEPDEQRDLPAAAAGAPIWRYVGRGGPDMARAASAFFAAWARAEADGLLTGEEIRFEAAGTSYDPRGAASLAPLAAGSAVAARVSEDPRRLGYADMLGRLASSQALIVFGSDDPAYTASKIYPYLLAGRPLLAIFHEQSSVVALMREVGGGVCVTFNAGLSEEALVERIHQAWFASAAWCTPQALDAERFTPWTARAQAAALAGWFREVLATAVEGRT